MCFPQVDHYSLCTLTYRHTNRYGVDIMWPENVCGNTKLYILDHSCTLRIAIRAHGISSEKRISVLNISSTIAIFWFLLGSWVLKISRNKMCTEEILWTLSNIWWTKTCKYKQYEYYLILIVIYSLNAKHQSVSLYLKILNTLLKTNTYSLFQKKNYPKLRFNE